MKLYNIGDIFVKNDPNHAHSSAEISITDISNITNISITIISITIIIILAIEKL